MEEVQRDFDMLEIPAEGVAAYWLSIKKLLGNKGSVNKAVEEEASYTSEPFVRFLLDTAFSRIPEDTVRRISIIKRDNLLAEWGLRFNLMRLALLDMASSENPARTLSRMTAHFSRTPIAEEKAFQLAQDLLKIALGKAKAKPEEFPRFFSVDHRLQSDKLLVVLLFYAVLNRREGKTACQPLLEHVRSPLFRDGLGLVRDGFDGDYLRERLRVHRETLLAEARLKMDMSLEMSMAIRNRLSYDDVFRVARAFLP